MAKKKKDVDGEQAEQLYDESPLVKPRTSKVGLIALIIILLIVGATAAVLYFDLFGARTQYLFPMLKNVPVIGSFIPGSETDPEDADPYANISKESLISENDQLKEQGTDDQKTIDDLLSRIDQLNKEIERLQEVEAQQREIKQQKADFDKMIAMNDLNAYKAFYESIAPENADALYQEVITTVKNDKELADYIMRFESMKAQSAADILQIMMETDINIVVSILAHMEVELAADILSKMTPSNASIVSKQLFPLQVLNSEANTINTNEENTDTINETIP